jgi:hypothetical protein
MLDENRPRGFASRRLEMTDASLPPLTSKAIVRAYVMRLAAQCPTSSST